MNPMLDPKRDLAGATPERLARALLRPLPLAVQEPVVGDEAAVEDVAVKEPADREANLRESA